MFSTVSAYSRFTSPIVKWSYTFLITSTKQIRPVNLSVTSYYHYLLVLTCKSLSFRCFETRVAIGSIQSLHCAVTTRAHSYLPHENSSPFDQHLRSFPTHPPLQQSGHYHSLYFCDSDSLRFHM